MNSNTETASSAWVAEAGAVFSKDVRLELRCRYALNAMAVFALTTLFVVSFAVGPQALSKGIAAALLWIVLLFSAIASLSRVFLREEEAHTAMALRLSAEPAHVFVGKLFFNIALLAALELLLVPLFLLIMQVRVGNATLLIVVLILGTAGLAAASTIVAAIISRAAAKGALFGGLAFPILLPLLLTAVSGTTRALEGAPLGAARGDLTLLLSFAGVIITASLLLFEHVWEE
jgi:heme exporter protein B